MPSEVLTYSGEEKLVIAFDLGATQSAVSFCHLVPGLAPLVRSVNHWPGQEEAAGHSKTPSLILYECGKAVAFGAEISGTTVSQDAQLAKWFKLHLNPTAVRFSSDTTSYATAHQQDTLPPLPTDISLQRIYTDYFWFLHDHTRRFFVTTVPDGQRIWDRLKATTCFVVATPNGWDDFQQGFLRRALILAEVLPMRYPPERLTFVTESEASIHSVLHHYHERNWLHAGDLIALMDAGGATVDTNLYKVVTAVPSLVLEEVQSSECVQAGATFVDLEAEKMLRRSLMGSTFGTEEFVQEIVKEFERKTKRQFDGSDGVSVIKFGRDTDNDKQYGIVRGRLGLTRSEVKATFEPSFNRILASTRKLLSQPNRQVKYLLLVGGYAGSPYLQSFLKEHWEPAGVRVITLDDSRHKAAAEGAVFWMTKHLVTARASRATYGVFRSRRYDENDPDHRERAHLAYVNKRRSGSWSLPGGLHVWVKKGDVIPESHKSLFDYQLKWTSHEKAVNDLASFKIEILAYDGDDDIDWCFDLNGHLLPGLRRVCILKVDLSSLRPLLQVKTRSDGSKSFRLNFNIAVMFGGTSLCALFQAANGDKSLEGPVAVIPVE